MLDLRLQRIMSQEHQGSRNEFHDLLDDDGDDDDVHGHFTVCSL